MPCTPEVHYLSSSSQTRQLFETLSDPCLGWQTILSTVTIFIAITQSVVVLESARRTRISFAKVRLLLGLEVVQILAAVVAELYSFFKARSALRDRLQWLHWVPICLLIYGIIGLVVDVVHTVHQSYLSRVKWLPFADQGNRTDWPATLISAFLLMCNLSFSLFLVGWRQEWWLKMRSGVESEGAVAAASSETSLSVGVLIFSLAWALLFMALWAVALTFFRSTLQKVIDKYLSTLHPNFIHFHQRYRGNRGKNTCGICHGHIHKRVGANPLNIFKQILWPHTYGSPYCFCHLYAESENSDRRQQLLLILLREAKQIRIDHCDQGIDKFALYKISIAQAGSGTSAQAATGTLAQAANRASAQVATGTSAQAANGTSEQAAYGTPAQAETGTLAQVANGASEQAANGTSEQAANGASAQVATGTSAQASNTISVRQTAADMRDSFDAEVDGRVRSAPLSIGNVVVGNHEEKGDIAVPIHQLFEFFVFVEQVSILPLLVVLVVAVSRLWSTVDFETHEAIKELSDAAVVYAVIEFAMSLKKLFSGTSCGIDPNVDNPFSKWEQRQTHNAP